MLTCATPEQHRLAAVAVHEAGHVVVGLEHGRVLTEVWASPGDGCAWFAGSREPLTDWQRLVCHVAGSVAEDLHALRCPHAHPVLRVGSRMRRYGVPDPDPDRLAYGDDLASATARARTLAEQTARRERCRPSGQDVVGVVLRAEQRAQRLLWRRWADVEALAVALCRAGRLSGAEALAALDRGRRGG